MLRAVPATDLPAPNRPEALNLPSWRDDLKAFLEGIARSEPPMEQSRERCRESLAKVLQEQVYPAFEEFLGEMTRHGIGGQIYGRETGYAITLRLDDGFEVAVERDRYREQGQILPRLIFVLYYEDEGRRYFTTDGISWDRVTQPEVIRRLVEEYKRWRILRMLTAGR